MNGIFGCGDRASKIAARDQEDAKRPEGTEIDSGNPGTNGLSEPREKTHGSSGLYGGHDRDRTCDPYHVKVVLSR